MGLHGVLIFSDIIDVLYYTILYTWKLWQAELTFIHN